MRRSGLASLAMFYHDFRDNQKKDLRGLLSSILFQLCDQSDSYHIVLSKFYSTHRDGTQSPNDDALADGLDDVVFRAPLGGFRGHASIVSANRCMVRCLLPVAGVLRRWEAGLRLAICDLRLGAGVWLRFVKK